jgi:HNH endonuclease
MSDTQPTVRYRLIPEFPTYRVGDDGSVWSYLLDGAWYRLKLSRQRSGHLLASLYRGNGQEYRQVHRLVLEAFAGPCPPGRECRHLNGNPADNRLSNLAWGTHVENMRDRIRHGTQSRHKGEANGQAKLTEDAVRRIRSEAAAILKTHGRYPYGTFTGLARKYGVSNPLIHMIVRGQIWQHVT